MESNTVVSLEVSTTHTEGMTTDKTIQSNIISKQTEPMSINQSSTDNSKQNASNNINKFSDKNEIYRCDDDDADDDDADDDDDDDNQIPNYVCSIFNADFGHTYENSTHITGDISKAVPSKPTQQQGSYVCMDNYIFLSDTELSEVDILNQTEGVLIKPSYTGKIKQTETMPNRVNNAGISKPNVSDNAPKINKRIIDLKDLVNLPSVYEDIVNKAEPDAVSTHEDNREISIYEDIIDKAEPYVEINMRDDDEDDYQIPNISMHCKGKADLGHTNQLDKTPSCKGINTKKKMNKVQAQIMTNKCKITLELLVCLVILILVVSLIVWGVKSRDKENKKAEPATNLTTIAFIECWDNSVNYSKHCNNSIETELTGIKENNTSQNISLLLRQETITRSTIAFIECWDNSVNYSKHCNNSIETELTGIKENNTSQNISLLLRQETTTRSGQNISVLMRQETATSSGKNGTSPANQKLTASIGFTAWATSVVSYSSGTTLIFNGMDEHDERYNGFDQGTGLFTCPITGIYYVYVTLKKNHLNGIYVDVFKMDTRIIRFYENYTGNPWNIVSNSALVTCSMDETIHMKGWSTGSIYGEANVRCSSFSVINMDQIAGNSPDQTFVGYSGYANSRSLRRRDPINFRNQLCNVGNQYSRNRFTCPYTGIYFVSVTYCRHPSTSSSYSVDAHLYRGDTHIFSSHDRYHPYHYVTNNALVRCNRGNYIGTKAGGPSYLYGSGSYPESIFTVMSLHQEDQSRPFIGFSRYKISRQDYSAGDVITFTGIIMDAENYFQSNQLVCPVDGSYYFLLNLKKSNYVQIIVSLKYGDKTALKLGDSSSKFSNTISSSAVIRCLKGEVVKVVAAGKGAVGANKRTTFSGFLLFKT